MNDLFEDVGIQITLHPSIVWAVYGLAVFFVLITSFFLIYHWKRYTFDKRLLRKVIAVYYCITVALLTISTASAVFYTLSSTL